MRVLLGRSLTSVRLATALVALAAGAPAGAQTLSGNLTVDDVFTAYLSTSPATQGAQVLLGGANWTITYSFGPVVLTPGQNYWLQVVAVDIGGVAGFVGDFTLTGPFHFANGLRHIATDITPLWTVQTGSFSGPSTGIHDLGENAGNRVFGPHPDIDPTAHWIWSSPLCTHCTRYFSTPIIAGGIAAVPEPSTWALFGTGLMGLGTLARRRRRAT